MIVTIFVVPKIWQLGLLTLSRKKCLEILQIWLNHIQPVFPFYTYRSGTLVENGLIVSLCLKLTKKKFKEFKIVEIPRNIRPIPNLD